MVWRVKDDSMLRVGAWRLLEGHSMLLDMGHNIISPSPFIIQKKDNELFEVFKDSKNSTNKQHSGRPGSKHLSVSHFTIESRELPLRHPHAGVVPLLCFCCSEFVCMRVGACHRALNKNK